MTARQLPLVYMLLASTGRAGDLHSHTIPEATDCTVCIAYSMDLWHYRKYSTRTLTSPSSHLRVVFCTVTLHTCPTASGWAVYTTASLDFFLGSTLSATEAPSWKRAFVPHFRALNGASRRVQSATLEGTTNCAAILINNFHFSTDPKRT